MTGIERLRTLAGAWDEWGLGGALAEIADQIERERAEDCYRMGLNYGTVWRVAGDMERHLLGHEGMEDSPVARWARELREALGGKGHDPAEDVSMSAYDLLPQEDRDAIAWVRERGGLDYVKSEWRIRVPYDRYERRRQRLLDHIAECEAALGRRREVISELNHRASDLTRENVKLRRRAMPEGMEWLVEVWPRFEDGTPVRIRDEISWRDEGGAVNSIELQDGGYFTLHAADGAGDWILPQYLPGERVRRPAKALDADGVEIRVGDWLYHKSDGAAVRVMEVDEKTFTDADDYVRPCDGYTHRAPVLAADGRPLEAGQTVWHLQEDEPHKWTVLKPYDEYDGIQTVLIQSANVTGHAKPSNLTHQRPVLDADGVPIKVGDTVWDVETGDRYTVDRVFSGTTEPDFPGHTVACRRPDDVVTHMFEPSQLTHRALVLAADGEPLEVGQTVWDTTKGKERTVIGFDKGKGEFFVKLHGFDPGYDYMRPHDLTHREPVLAADGRPLEAGQTVWDTDAESDTPLTVVEVSSDLVRCEYTWRDGKTYRPCYPPDQLTHTKPEPQDSAERIADDIRRMAEEWCSHPSLREASEKAASSVGEATMGVALGNLSKRCRALAERERGE